jgi:hypothetical protein
MITGSAVQVIGQIDADLGHTPSVPPNGRLLAFPGSGTTYSVRHHKHVVPNEKMVPL